MKNNFFLSRMLLFFFSFFCIGKIFLSCGLPEDTPVLRAVRSIGSFDPLASAGYFENKPVSGEDYDPKYCKSFNFYYRIYSKTEYEKLGSSLKDKEKAIISEAQNKLTASVQKSMLSSKEKNSRFGRYFKMIKIDPNVTPVTDADWENLLTEPHFPLTDLDFIESSLPVSYEYKVTFPSLANNYCFTVERNRKNRNLIQNPTVYYYHRRVYDEVIEKRFARPKSWLYFHYQANGYTNQKPGYVLPDEDLFDKELPFSSVGQQESYYICYFVSIRGMWKTKIQFLYSPVSLLGIQQVERELIQSTN